VWSSRAISDSIELVQRANLKLVERTSLRRCACFPRVFFSPIWSANEPAARAGWSGPILTNRRVSGRVGLAFSAWGCCLRAKGAFGGPFAAATCAYVVRGLAVAGGEGVVGETGVIGVGGAGWGAFARGPWDPG
jgi:hypothetical protein